MELFAEIAAERHRVADLVDALSDEELATRSLCGEWTVHQVAGHLLMPLVTPLPVIAASLARHGGRFDRANAALAVRTARRPAAEIAEELRRRAGSRFTPPGFGPEAPLTDLQVHRHDMRRALGMAADLDPDRLRVSLDFLCSPAATRGFVRRGRLDGLRLQATDLDWATGAGPVVLGTGEALLLAITGRRPALADLAGDGGPLLAQRL